MTESSMALEARLSRIENDVKVGFDRIEDMIRREIQEIKAEQISDLRETIKRLADDQRRLWDLVHAMGIREGQRSKFVGSIWHVLTALCSGGLVAVSAKLWGGGTPPPHP